MGSRAVIIAFVAYLSACAAGHCRRSSLPPAEAKPLEATPAARADNLRSNDRVLVYKYDGSAQCGQGRARSLDQMARDLGDIPILSRQQRSDGLMHIKACGASTGMANVYEISAPDLPRAERMGFKRWTFQTEAE